MYFNDFSNRQDIIKDFEIDESVLEGANIVFASYGGQCYEGDAIVILTRDDKLFEAHGSHCSCHGLEEQWDEEETTWESLYDRYVKPKNEHQRDWFIEGHGADASVELNAIIEYEVMEKHLLSDD